MFEYYIACFPSTGTSWELAAYFKIGDKDSKKSTKKELRRLIKRCNLPKETVLKHWARFYSSFNLFKRDWGL